MDYEKEIELLKNKTNELHRTFRLLNTATLILGISVLIHMIAHILKIF